MDLYTIYYLCIYIYYHSLSLYIYIYICHENAANLTWTSTSFCLRGPVPLFGNSPDHCRQAAVSPGTAAVALAALVGCGCELQKTTWDGWNPRNNEVKPCKNYQLVIRISSIWYVKNDSRTDLSTKFTLWLFNIAMENDPFIDDFPSSKPPFSSWIYTMAMLVITRW